ncbi:MAG: hypothetical protein KDI51_10250, partial [Xanthomonadales bacterium]|nr:hypothetical protein [Xanthomonadales bacterium]
MPHYRRVVRYDLSDSTGTGFLARAPHFRPNPLPMFNAVLTKIFGSRNERIVRGLRKNVAKINALEPEFQALSD